MARLCIRTFHKGFISESFLVLIEGISFEISLLENSFCSCVTNTRFNTEEDDQTTTDSREDSFSDEDSLKGDSDKPRDMVLSDKGLADKLMVIEEVIKDGSTTKVVGTTEIGSQEVSQNKVYLGRSFLNQKGGKPSVTLNDESSQALNSIYGMVSTSKGSRVGDSERKIHVEALLTTGSSGDRLTSSKPNYRIGPSHNGPHILEPLSFDKAYKDMMISKCKKMEKLNTWKTWGKSQYCAFFL